MSDNPFHRAIYLTGPTASGKTAIGVALAQRLDAEIIALDSMTLYRGMDIGTAKPTLKERQGVPHHLIDVIDPWNSASVANYRIQALNSVLEIESRGKQALFVGGTPLYLKALLRGLFEGPPADIQLRNDFESDADRRGNAALHARLAVLDSQTAARLHPNDRRRVIRALEVFTIMGRPLSELHREHEKPAVGVSVFALERPRDVLCDRINQRVLTMFREGLVNEVRQLIDAPKPIGVIAAQGVGYRETITMLEGQMGEAETIDLIQSRTRQFAKRQATWFRGLAEVQPWPIVDDQTAEHLAVRLS